MCVTVCVLAWASLGRPEQVAQEVLLFICRFSRLRQCGLSEPHPSWLTTHGGLIQHFPPVKTLPLFHANIIVNLSTCVCLRPSIKVILIPPAALKWVPSPSPPPSSCSPPLPRVHSTEGGASNIKALPSAADLSLELLYIWSIGASVLLASLLKGVVLQCCGSSMLWRRSTSSVFLHPPRCLEKHSWCRRHDSFAFYCHWCFVLVEKNKKQMGCHSGQMYQIGGTAMAELVLRYVQIDTNKVATWVRHVFIPKKRNFKRKEETLSFGSWSHCWWVSTATPPVVRWPLPMTSIHQVVTQIEQHHFNRCCPHCQHCWACGWHMCVSICSEVSIKTQMLCIVPSKLCRDVFLPPGTNK